MNKVYFVTEDYIKENSEVQDTTDIKYLKKNIIVAQDIYIQQILGTELFNDIKNSIINNSISTEYRTLLENYIQPTVLYYALYKSIPFLSIKITNKSVNRKEADNAKPIDTNDVKFLQNEYLNTAEFYSERMIGFLLENYEDDYPLYNNSYNTDKDEMQHKSNSPYSTGGLYLGDIDINRCNDFKNN